MKKILAVILLMLFIVQQGHFMVHADLNSGKLQNQNVQKLIIDNLRYKQYIDEKFESSKYSFSESLKIIERTTETYNLYYNSFEKGDGTHCHDSSFFGSDCQPLNYKERTISDLTKYILRKILIYSQSKFTNEQYQEIITLIPVGIKNLQILDYEMEISTFVCGVSTGELSYFSSYVFVEDENFLLIQLVGGSCETHGGSGLYVSYDNGKTLKQISIGENNVYTLSMIGTDFVELNEYNAVLLMSRGLITEEELIQIQVHFEVPFEKKIEIKFEEFKDYIIKY